MKFSAVVEQVLGLLQRQGRVSYRMLKREFDLDDELFADLKEELLYSHAQEVREEGLGLVWIGEPSPASSVQGQESKTVPSSDASPQMLDPRPVSYTPTHLAERIRTSSLADGERKVITALFADLKGSTALIEGLDPEEARAIIDPALQLMMDAVHRYEGYVAQALGDGIFALFGAPIAHEDHPQRALYAALRMQEEMRRYADRLREQGYPPLLMRVGINTGEVVVRSIRKEDLHTDYVPIGHSTNLAARMEQLAAPGSVLVTAHTHKLTTGYFEFKALGKTQIKGVEEPLAVYEVLGAGPLRTKLQVAAQRGLTRFVGRQSELAQMHLAFAQAKAGHGQIVGVMGEPGMGKSRLFYEFKLTAQSGVLVLEAFSLSHGKASAYLPVIELLKSYFDITAEDDERKRREKVGGKVLMLDRSLEDILPYLLTLLGLEDPSASLQQMDAQIRRRRTFEALKRLFLRESLNQPLILIFEDLHWIDTETQGFLDALRESIANAQILLLVNYRPEYRHDWGTKTYYTQLRLAPLGTAEAEEFLDVLLGTTAGATVRSPLRDLKQLILDKTQGTPFFMEEVVQELREQGVLKREISGEWILTSPSMALQLPTTVQGVLAARIDRLAPDEKALLQQLAVLGREFPLSLARQVVQQSEAELYRLFSSLQNKEFLYEQPAFPEVEYIFKHALTQEVAYNSVLQERRKALHERTAQALETLYSANLEEHYSELAHHYSRSGNIQKAIQYLGLAGQQAVQRSAYTEAVSHLTLALELLKTLPDTLERVQQELPLLITLGFSLIAATGYTTPAVGQTFTRARELCQQVGETPQLFFVLRGLWLFYLLRAEYEAARELASQGLNVAQRLQDAILLLGAHQDMEFFLLMSGEWGAARTHFERVMAFYDPQQHGTYVALNEADIGVWAMIEDALALWCLGYPDQAQQKCQETLTLAHKLAHPNTLGWTLICAAWLHQYLREPQKTQEQAEATITLSNEHGFPPWLGYGTGFQGWALAMQGQHEEGIAHIRQGMTSAQDMGTGMSRSHHLALLAEALSHAGYPEEGLTVLAEALEFVEQRGERFYEAELHRLKGEFLLAQEIKSQKSKVKNQKLGNPEPNSQSLAPQDEAEACFLTAIVVAQKQHAKSWELRAVMSLARLRQQQALEQGAESKEVRAESTEEASRSTQHATRLKLDEAHRMLSDVYHWFTEGFDTKDLQEAKAMLDKLSHQIIEA